jgi:hypothetical protein
MCSPIVALKNIKMITKQMLIIQYYIRDFAAHNSEKN